MDLINKESKKEGKEKNKEDFKLKLVYNFIKYSQLSLPSVKYLNTFLIIKSSSLILSQASSLVIRKRAIK